MRATGRRPPRPPRRSPERLAVGLLAVAVVASTACGVRGDGAESAGDAVTPSSAAPSVSGPGGSGGSSCIGADGAPISCDALFGPPPSIADDELGAVAGPIDTPQSEAVPDQAVAADVGTLVATIADAWDCGDGELVQADPFELRLEPDGEVVVPRAESTCAFDEYRLRARASGIGAWDADDGTFIVEITLATPSGAVSELREGTVDVDGRRLGFRGRTYDLREV